MIRKGQMGIMEYLMLTFFIMVIVVVIIIFVSGWQISQVEMNQAQQKTQRVITLSKNVLSSQFFVKEESMFDDSKLYSLIKMGTGPGSELCNELELTFGANWFMEVANLTCTAACRPTTDYMSCCNWTFCKPADMSQYQVDMITVPVNIQRKIGFVHEGTSIFPRTEIGIMRVGVYSAIE